MSICERNQQVASTRPFPIFSPDSKGFVKNIQQELAPIANRLDKTISRGFKVCLLTPGAAARSGEAFSFFKHIPAGHTTERQHHELSLLCCCRQGDVRQMFVDFPFPNADGLGDLPCGHLLLVQEEEHPLANGLGMAFAAHDLLSRKGVPLNNS